MRERGKGSIYRMKGSQNYWIKYYVNGRPKRESSGSSLLEDAENLLKKRIGPRHEVNISPVMNYTIKLTGASMMELKQPCVYCWKRGDEYLYIGKSVYGISRPLDGRHHVMGSADKIWHNDELTIIFQPTNEDAEALEKSMIQEHRPKYNVVGLRGAIRA